MTIHNSDMRGQIVKNNRPALSRYEEIYRDVHMHAELSCKKNRTSQLIASELKKLGYIVTEHIEGTEVIEVLKNENDLTIMLRAELDALPLKEKTELSYVSKQIMTDQYEFERHVMHACEHDIYLTCLLDAAHSLKNAHQHWSEILLVLFQSNEEHTEEAEAMIKDELYDKIPVLDVVLEQHSDAFRVERVTLRSGNILTTANIFRIRVFDSSKHSVNSQAGLNPISLDAHIVVRLNIVISEEISSLELAVITCEEFHDDQQGLNTVDYADLVLDVKAYKPEIREQLHDAIKRVVHEECKAADATRESQFTISRRASITFNDSDTVKSLQREFEAYFDTSLKEGEPRRSCEDFSILVTFVSKSYAYWFFDTVDNAKWDKLEREERLKKILQDHSSYNALALHSILETDVDALALAALTFLVKESEVQ